MGVQNQKKYLRLLNITTVSSTEVLSTSFEVYTYISLITPTEVFLTLKRSVLRKLSQTYRTISAFLS